MVKIIVNILAFLLVIQVVKAEVSDKTKPQEKLSVIEVELWSEGVSSEVWLNDIPVAYVDKNQGALSVSEWAHHFLVPGKNLIEIRTPAPKYPDGGGLSEDLREIEVTARIVKRTDGELNGREHGQTLLKCEKKSFTEEEYKANKITYTMAIGVVDAVKKDWAWKEKAETLTEKDFPSLIKKLRELQEALEKGNVKAFTSIYRHYSTDMAYCYPAFGGSEFWDENIESIITYLKDYPEAIVDWKEDDLALRVCGNGKLIQAIRKDWTPVFKSETAGPELESLAGHYYFAKIDGEWQIVR